MTSLNLPTYDFKVKKSEGKVWIFDPMRKKYVVLTPEEWVRQHFVNFLVQEHHYPKSLFRIEGGLTYNKLLKRSDILVYNREGKPWLLVECKSPTIKMSQRAFNQVAIYNMTIGAKYLAITNGIVHYCCVAPKPGEEGKFLDDFPEFESVFPAGTAD